MKTIIFVLALVGFLPQFCSTTKSIHDWAHELGNKLGPGYSFREVERNGRTCICSTTTQFSTPTIPISSTAAEPAPPSSSSTVQPDLHEPSSSSTVPPDQHGSSSSEAPVHYPSSSVDTDTDIDHFGSSSTLHTTVVFQFGAREFSCDDNVVPAVNDRNAATKYSFSTPMYPEEYPQGICCTWRIVYPEKWQRQTSSKIITYNYSPDSYLPEDCVSDFITVYDIAANNKLIEREQKCGHIGGQLGIIKHDGDERGAAFKVCRDEERSQKLKKAEAASTGKVAVSFTVVSF